MDSAFYFYDLTDVIPNKVYLATPSNYRTIKNEKIEVDDCDLYINNYLEHKKRRLLVSFFDLD